MKTNLLQKNIPKGWNQMELGDIADIIMGQSPSSSFYNQDGNGLPFFQGKADFDKSAGVKIRQWTSFVTKTSDAGDILLSVRAPVGDIALNNTKACIGRGLASLRVKEGVADQNFLFQLMMSLKSDLNKKSQGSTFKAINGPALKQINTIIPPIKEQKKIAEILSSVDEEIQKVEEIISATEKLKHGLMQNIFSKDINEKNTKWVRLGDVCTTSSGGTPLKSKREYYENGTIPWLTSGEVRQGHVNESKQFITKQGLENSSAKIFPKNTILIAMYGATAGQVGLLDFECSTNQAICGVLPNNEFYPEFLYQFLLTKTKSFTNQAIGAAQPNISQAVIRDTVIPVPDLEKQHKIAEVISSIDNKISISKNLKSKLSELKNGLVSDLLSGKVRTINS